MSDAPASLSVVVPAVNGAEPLRECLRAIESQAESGGIAIETVVISRLPSGSLEALAREFPRIRIVPGEGLTIPQMRAKGFSETRAPIVAVLSDQARVVPTWAKALLAGHATSAVAVGGSVTNGCSGAAAWAAFFAEYSEHMTPLPEGDVPSLPGVNVSYKRPTVEACGGLSGGAWESLLHEALRDMGFAFRCEPGAEAVLVKSFSFGRFASQKWHIARSRAGLRSSRMSGPRRILFAARTALLPPLLTVRIVRRVLARPGQGYGGALLRSLPFLLILVSLWTVGEFVGYLSGEGGSTVKVL